MSWQTTLLGFAIVLVPLAPFIVLIVLDCFPPSQPTPDETGGE